eukprot:tig00020554_g10831.t1
MSSKTEGWEPADFQADNFRSDEFIGAVSKRLWDQALETGPGFKPDHLAATFEHALEELRALERQVDRKNARMAESVEELEATHRKHVARLDGSLQGVFADFKALDLRISGVGEVAVRIGDTMEMVETQRRRAEEARELVQYVLALNDDETHVEFRPVFTDPDRIDEGCKLVQRLHSFAPELREGPLARAAGKVQELADMMEAKLLGEFERASKGPDLPTLRRVAHAAFALNGGGPLVSVHIGRRPMFLRADPLGQDLRALEEAGSPDEGLRRLFAEIVASVRREGELIAQVFPGPDKVAAALAARVLEQRVAPLVEALLEGTEAPEPLAESEEEPEGEEEGAEGPAETPEKPRRGERGAGKGAGRAEAGDLGLGRLEVLSAAYSRTLDLAKQARPPAQLPSPLPSPPFSSSGPACSCPGRPAAPRGPWYFEEEEAHLRASHAARVAAFLQARGEAPPGGRKKKKKSKEAGPEALAASGAASGPLVSPELVEALVETSRGALARCRALADEAALARHSHMAYRALTEAVGAYLSAAMSAVVERGEASRGKADAYLEVYRSARGSGAALIAALRHFVAAVQPQVAGFVSWHTSCVADRRALVATAENLVLAALERALEGVLAHVRSILQNEQRPRDFRPREEGEKGGAGPDAAFSNNEPTPACGRAVEVLAQQARLVSANLDGDNRASFLTELASRLQRLIIAHIKRFTFSTAGGLQLLRDMTEYASWGRALRLPAVDALLEPLPAAANLYLVPPEVLGPVVSEGPLARLPAAEVAALVRLRDDYKRSAGAIQKALAAARPAASGPRRPSGSGDDGLSAAADASHHSHGQPPPGG